MGPNLVIYQWGRYSEKDGGRVNRPDLIITNANIITLDKHNTIAGSVAVTNGRISGIWKEQEPPRNEVMRDGKTEVLNLKGKTLLPGFIDTHNHLLMYAVFQQQVDCRTPPNQSIDDIIKNIKEKAETLSPGEWIIGWGYDDTLLKEKRHPTREDLDKAAPHHPVYISHISGHLAAVNSMALKLAGLGDSITDPKGGHFGRDTFGRLNGVIYELSALKMIQDVLPKANVHQLASLLGEAAYDYVRQGITTSTEAAAGLQHGEMELEAYLLASQKDFNPLKMRLMIMHEIVDAKYAHYTPQQLNQELLDRSDQRVKLDSIKLFQDGSIQGLTAALRQPYHNQPHLNGELIYEQEQLNQLVLKFHKKGYRLAIHGNGDRAIGSILDAYQFALISLPRPDHRHRIEHVQTATIEDLDRIKTLNVAASFFINHVYYWGDRHARLFLGSKRASRINPLQEAVQRDILFTLHSDCPITPISPLFSIWAAVNRLTKDGDILGADQRIDVLTALKAMTSAGAILNFEEEETGSIEVGKQADLVVLGENPLRCHPLEIKDIPIDCTIIAGQIKHCLL